MGHLATLFVVALLTASLDAACKLRNATVLCTDHFRLADITRHTSAQSLAFAAVAGSSGCFTAHRLQLGVPGLKRIEIVTKPATRICNCILQAGVPCGLRIGGCSKISIFKKCDSIKTGDSSTGVITGSVLGVLLGVLGVTGAIVFFRLKKRISHLDQSYRNLMRDVTNITQTRDEIQMEDIKHRDSPDHAEIPDQPELEINVAAQVHSPPKNFELIKPVQTSTPTRTQDADLSPMQTRSQRKKTQV